MKKQYRLAFNALKKLGVPVYEREDMNGRFQISAEDISSDTWCNYYNMRSDWDFGVNPVLENVLRKYGLHSEWINPGELGVYD